MAALDYTGLPRGVLVHGEGGQSEIDLIAELAETMQLTSICGLGQVAAAPITSALKYFPEEILAHIRDRRCPAGVCPVRD